MNTARDQIFLRRCAQHGLLGNRRVAATVLAKPYVTDPGTALIPLRQATLRPLTLLAIKLDAAG